jgi:hypothetical protein
MGAVGANTKRHTDNAERVKGNTHIRAANQPISKRNQQGHTHFTTEGNVKLL